MSVRVACYNVFCDEGITATRGGDIDKEVNIGGLGAIDVGVASVLSFMLRPVNPVNLEFEINIINGLNKTTKLIKESTSYNHWRVWQEIVGGGVLTADDKNKLQIRAVGGTGSLVISDVVLLYSKYLKDECKA
jgi:hypothetical protein